MTTIQNKALIVVLGGCLLILALLSILLGIKLKETHRELQVTQLQAEGIEAYLSDYAAGLQSQLTVTESDLAAQRRENEGLQEDVSLITAEKEGIETLTALYREQKYYLADALDWVGSQYGYDDIGEALRTYALSAEQDFPKDCVVIPANRYLKWQSIDSTLFVVTPEKMGLSPYTYWSIRENVVFGPSHRDIPGYLGSRGYEFRYPLVLGSRFQQEVHTTLDIYDFEIEKTARPPGQFQEMVELDCGIPGYVTVSDDDAQTTKISFVLGDFAANVKLKYEYDLPRAISLLKQAANVVIGELTSDW